MINLQDNVSYIIDVLKGNNPHFSPDWFKVVGFLLSHKIAGMFYNKAKIYGIELPKKIEFLLRDVFEKQRRNVAYKREYIKDISVAFEHSAVKHALLKGSVLVNAKFGRKQIYADGERISNDVDILVSPTEITGASKVLSEMGFVQGTYDRLSHKIIEFPRAEIIKRRMTRGEVAPFVKLTDNAEFPFVEMDINFSLGNTPDDGQKLLRAIVDSAQYRDGEVRICSPSNEMFFAHLIMHQYKESCLYFMVKRSKELDVYKLADMYYLLRSNVIDLNILDRIIRQYEISDRAGAVLQQVGEVFNDERILQLAEEYGVEQPEVIDYDGKKKYAWQASISERLRKFSAMELLKEVGQC